MMQTQSRLVTLSAFSPSPSSKLIPVSPRWLATEVAEEVDATVDVVAVVADVEAGTEADPTLLPWDATAGRRLDT